MYIFYSLNQKDLDNHLIKNTSASLSVVTLLKKKKKIKLLEVKSHMH